jgi:hypothetical protein
MSNKVFIAKVEGEDAKKLAEVLHQRYSISAEKNKDGSVELYAEE